LEMLQLIQLDLHLELSLQDQLYHHLDILIMPEDIDMELNTQLHIVLMEPQEITLQLLLELELLDTELILSQLVQPEQLMDGLDQDIQLSPREFNQK